MRIADALRGPRPAVSFEFFPPRDEEGAARLLATIGELRSFAPTYVSVTYGAGGSTRALTVDLARRMQSELGLCSMAHLTCVGATREDLQAVLQELRSAGVTNVLALRGDPPKGQAQFVAVPGGFSFASELASFVRSQGDFCVAGACYPEVHPEAGSAEEDLAHLREKVDAGAEFLISQLFFDPEVYFRFASRARDAGITVPIVAGVMPITNLSQVKKFTSLCGATIPAELLSRLEEVSGQPEAVEAVGVEYAIRQCEELLRGGAPGIHFYTLNRSPATRRVLEALRSTGVV